MQGRADIRVMMTSKNRRGNAGGGSHSVCKESKRYGNRKYFAVPMGFADV